MNQPHLLFLEKICFIFWLALTKNYLINLIKQLNKDPMSLQIS